jgi:hypothetical protein
LIVIASLPPPPSPSEVKRSGTGRRNGDDAVFRSRRSVDHAAVRAHGVPGLDQHPGLGEAVERVFAVEQFITKRPVEALVIAVLPWPSRRDVERLHADPGRARPARLAWLASG